MFLLLVFIAGCAQNDGNVGKGISNPGIGGEVMDTVFYPAAVDTFYHLQVNTGGVQNLLLGAYSGFQTKFLLKFANFSDLPDSFQLDSAKIKLRMNAFIGDTAVVCPEMEFSVHQLIELLPDDDWSETNITWDSVLSWDSAPIFDTLLAQEPDSDSISFYVPNDIVLQWIEAEEPADTSGGDTLEIPNTGLIFNYLGTPEFIRQFFPSEMSDSTLKPQLMLFITTSDSLWLDSTGIDSLGQDTSLTLTCYATDDVFIARDTIQLADNRLYLGRGDAYRSLYWLNMEDLLPVFGININKAEYIIFVDSENPLSTGEFVACQRLKLNNLDWMTDPMQADYTSTLVSSSSILGDSLILDLTSYMKDWVTDPGCNYGFVLKFTSESGSIARLPVYTPEELDPSKRPYLHIIYSTGGE